MSETTSPPNSEFASTEASQAQGKRMIVEITDWDWHLHIGMPHPSMPKALLYQGWLSYTRGLEVQGRVVSPSAYHWKTLSLWLMDLPPKPRVSKAELADPPYQRVGHIGPTTSPDRRTDFSASVHLPQDALASTVTALGSVWKILQLWAVGDPEVGASIDWYGFSRGIPPKLVQDRGAWD